MSIKDAFICKLDPAEAAWVEKQALVFPSRSAVIRTAVRVVLALIDKGRLTWSFAELEELLRGYQRNPEGQSSGQSSGQGGSSFAARTRPPRRESYSLAVSAAREAKERRRSYEVTPFRATLRRAEILLS